MIGNVVDNVKKTGKLGLLDAAKGAMDDNLNFTPSQKKKETAASPQEVPTAAKTAKESVARSVSGTGSTATGGGNRRGSTGSSTYGNPSSSTPGLPSTDPVPASRDPKARCSISGGYGYQDGASGPVRTTPSEGIWDIVKEPLKIASFTTASAVIGGLLGYGVIKAIAALGPAARGIGQFIATNVLDKAVKKIPQKIGMFSNNSENNNQFNTKLTLMEALKELDDSGIRPGQDVLSRSQLNDVINKISNNYNPSIAYSSVNNDGANRYLVEGHHTTVAFKMLGKDTSPNMNIGTSKAPSTKDVYWTKKWYQLNRKSIKIIN